MYENYTCGAERNYTGYCNRELEQEFERQSSETDQDKRKQLVWQIDRKLQEEVVQPIIAHTRLGTCWQPWVKDLTLLANSLYNGWRMRHLARQINRDYGWPLRSRRAVSSVKAEWPRRVESRTSNHGLTAVPITEGNVIG